MVLKLFLRSCFIISSASILLLSLTTSGKVGVEDWEKDAVLMINNWGTGFCTSYRE